MSPHQFKLILNCVLALLGSTYLMLRGLAIVDNIDCQNMIFVIEILNIIIGLSLGWNIGLLVKSYKKVK